MLQCYIDNRNVGLKHLQPSAKDLEHGLELHKNSLVWDAYGFSPNGPVDGALADDLIDKGVYPEDFTDAMERYRQTEFLKDPNYQKVYAELWEYAGVNCIFQNSGVEGNRPDLMIKRFSNYLYNTDKYPNLVRRAAFPHQVEQAFKDNVPALYFTTNGVPLPYPLNSASEAFRYLDVFYHLGTRMMHLSYNRHNLLGGGCGEKTDMGLTELGRAVIEKMNEIGIIVDVAHSSQQTSFEAAKASTKPMVASHTVAGALSCHCRAKNDQTCKAIADTGGYIGVCMVPRFLRRSGDINAFIDHLDYLIKLVGPDHVAVGTDTAAWCDEFIPQTKNYSVKTGVIDSIWPNEDYVETDEMYQSLCWTNWPLITVGLVMRGYSDEDIQKVIGLNVLRVTKEVLTDI